MFVTTMLVRLFFASTIVSAAMTIALVIYRNTLSPREDDPLYIDKTERAIMASDQPKLIAQMRWLTRLIYFFIAITVILLVATIGVLVCIGLRSLS